MGAAFGAFRTTLLLGDQRLALSQFAVSGTLDYRLARAWTLQVSAGGTFLGRLGEGALGGGGTVGVSVSWVVLEQGKYWPFIQLAGSLSGSLAQAQPTLYSAFDARLGVAVGYTFWQRFSPYLTARAFGGPVLFAGQLGTDLYHYQVGVGFAVGLPGNLDLSAELVPLGEQRVTAAIGYSF